MQTLSPLLDRMKLANAPSYCLLALLVLLPFSARSEGYLGINISSPLVVSGTAGLYLDSGVEVGSQALRTGIEGELGIGGGKILIGMDTIGQGLGYGIKGSLLRTWFEPIGADEDNTYLGLEVQGSIQSLILSLGGYRRVDGDGDGWLGTVSLGFRF
ncbi:MAG: hypothetical protein AAGJ81_06330 [Verrucomicrobiota bacterium]